MRASVNKRLRFQWLFLIAVLVAALWVWLIQARPLLQVSAWQFWVAIIIPVTRQSTALIQLLGLQAYTLAATPDHLWGQYSAEEIRRFAHEAAQQLNGHEVPNLYIAVDKSANAMAVNSLLVNFIPRLNAIYLNSYLLKTLTPLELRAILAHELAHFHRYMSPLTRNTWVATLGDGAVLVFLFLCFPNLSLITWVIICILYWIWAPFTILYNLVDMLTARDLEFCADLVAAELVGCLPMINALLKIGDRAEVYEAVEERVAELLERYPALNAAQVIQKLNDLLPDTQIGVRQAKRLFNQNLKPDAAEMDGDKDENKKLLKDLLSRRALRKALRVYHWNRFDVIHRDNSLDGKELASYLNSLAGSPLHATHKVSSDHPDYEPYQTHPSMKKRILYLYLHCLD